MSKNHVEKSRISNLFYSLRGFAIISVAYAHSLSLCNDTMQRIYTVIGLLGVPIFLFCSGFYFKQQSKSNLIKKLTTDIVIPWLIWGIFNFFITISTGKTELNALSFLKYICGYGTWLYYIPVYLIIRILYQKYNSNLFVLTTIIVSLASSLLTHLYLLTQNTSVTYWITPYQNPLNWLSFYALGITCNRSVFLTGYPE